MAARPASIRAERLFRALGQASQQASNYQMVIEPAGVLDGFNMEKSLPFCPIQATSKATQEKARDLVKHVSAVYVPIKGVASCAPN